MKDVELQWIYERFLFELFVHNLKSSNFLFAYKQAQYKYLYEMAQYQQSGAVEPPVDYPLYANSEDL